MNRHYFLHCGVLMQRKIVFPLMVFWYCISLHGMEDKNIVIGKMDGNRDITKQYLSYLKNKDIELLSLVNKKMVNNVDAFFPNAERKENTQKRKIALLETAKQTLANHPDFANVHWDTAIAALERSEEYINQNLMWDTISNLVWNKHGDACAFILKKRDGSSALIKSSLQGDGTCKTVRKRLSENAGYEAYSKMPYFVDESDPAILLYNFNHKHALELSFDQGGGDLPVFNFFWQRIPVEKSLESGRFLYHLRNYPILARQCALAIRRNRKRRFCSLDDVRINDFSLTADHEEKVKTIICNSEENVALATDGMSNEELLAWVNFNYTYGNKYKGIEYSYDYKKRVTSPLSLTLGEIGNKYDIASLIYSTPINEGVIKKICTACDLEKSTEPLKSFLDKSYTAGFLLRNSQGRSTLHLSVTPSAQDKYDMVQLKEEYRTPLELYRTKINGKPIIIPNEYVVAFAAVAREGCTSQRLNRPPIAHSIVQYRVALLLHGKNGDQQVSLYKTDTLDNGCDQEEPFDQGETALSSMLMGEYLIESNHKAETIAFDAHNRNLLHISMQPTYCFPEPLIRPMLTIDTSEGKQRKNYEINTPLFNPITLTIWTLKLLHDYQG
jgi:hypothetical protein